MATWTLFVCALVMLVSAAAPRRVGESHGAAVLTESIVAPHELSEDDPPRDPEHRESPAKKPRLKTLLVQTGPAADPALPMAFHLLAADNVPTPYFVPLLDESAPSTGREDPVLRLHPGQAPPRVA